MNSFDKGGYRGIFRGNLSAVSLLKTAVFITILAACLKLYPHIHPEEIEAFISHNQVAAPLLFIVICALKPLLFFLPPLGLTIIAGTLFGALWGAIYVAIGGAFSAIVGFYFARWFGRNVTDHLIRSSSAIQHMDEWSKHHGKRAVLFMRLLNVPWDLVSYWAGVTGVSFRDFYAASLIPLIPISFLYTYCGSQIFTPWKTGFVLSLTLIILLGFLPYVMKWNKRKQTTPQ